MAEGTGLWSKLEALLSPARPLPSRPGKLSSPRAEAFARKQLVDGTSADHKKLVEIAFLLEQTEGGQHDLRVISEGSVRIQFDTRAGGAGYRPYDNRIILNRMHTSARTATSLVHEATHAHFKLTRTGADILQDERNTFVENMLREETLCYFREAVLGRELLHAARRAGADYWRQFLTAHELQMWFQLVHRVRYTRRPSDEVLERDASLSPEEVAAAYQFVKPYFARYVDAYRATEYAKWDIRHGRRSPIAADVMADLLSMSFEEQSREYTQPMQPAGASPFSTVAPRPRRSVRGAGVIA